MADERERVRRQLALDTTRRQRLFEHRAREREAAEEDLVRQPPSKFHLCVSSKAPSLNG
jgi:hypothetical protein